MEMFLIDDNNNYQISLQEFKDMMLKLKVM